jgi:YHS domain-containing protein
MKAIFAAFLTMLIASTVFGQSADTRKKQFNVNGSGLAIEGYDPVAYFMENKAIEGKKEITTAYQGITYRFATVHDRDLFLANPSRYEPQYGGWCAYAMGAKGQKVEVDPGTFKITDGKLFLFYNKYFNNTLKDWNRDEVHLKANADKSWAKIIR